MVRNARALSRIAKSFSQPLGLIDRLLNTWRPRIFPFHDLMEYVPDDARVLDIGCGTGLWLYLLSRTKRISFGLGVEVDLVKVDLANAIKTAEDRLEFRSIPPEMQWPSGNFDCLTMIDVLHHVPPPHQRDFLRRIEQTGATRIVFKDIDPTAKCKAAMNTLHDLLLSHQRPRYREKEMVAEWLEEIGYCISHEGRHDMLWYSHYLVVADKA